MSIGVSRLEVEALLAPSSVLSADEASGWMEEGSELSTTTDGAVDSDGSTALVDVNSSEMTTGSSASALKASGEPLLTVTGSNV